MGMQQSAVENTLQLRRSNFQGRWKERERRIKDSSLEKPFNTIAVKKPVYHHFTAGSRDFGSDKNI